MDAKLYLDWYILIAVEPPCKGPGGLDRELPLLTGNPLLLARKLKVQHVPATLGTKKHDPAQVFRCIVTLPGGVERDVSSCGCKC